MGHDASPSVMSGRYTKHLSNAFMRSVVTMVLVAEADNDVSLLTIEAAPGFITGRDAGFIGGDYNSIAAGTFGIMERDARLWRS
jgi:hypothetical protein